MKENVFFFMYKNLYIGGDIEKICKFIRKNCKIKIFQYIYIEKYIKIQYMYIYSVCVCVCVCARGVYTYIEKI